MVETDIEYGGARVVIRQEAFNNTMRSLAEVVASTLRAHRVGFDHFIEELNKQGTVE
jgi:hypothetical protein